MESLSIPPGFESLVPFTLKKMEDNHVGSYPRSVSASEAQNILLETVDDSNDSFKNTKSLKRRPSVKVKQFGSSSGDEFESEEVDQGTHLRNWLPKGVIRGCEACQDCQRVIAKWHPEEARRPYLEDAPVFYPSNEEFEDSLKYISSIRSEAEKYGICRIVPPSSWKPPCPLKERDIWQTSKFKSRIQRIDKLQNRDSMRINHDKRTKKRRCHKSRVGNTNDINESLEVPLQNFGFEPGPDFTLDAFQKYADDFKAQYFRKNNNSSNSGGKEHVLYKQWEPSVEDIEGEYWRMVEKPSEEIEVLYGADVETGAFGSGFPKSTQQLASASDIKYINSGWNLNNFPRLPGSVLSFESADISGVLVPWLYVGMCFSSFCWHVEDHHLYSINYMHWGAHKMWYGVPRSHALQLEAAMRKHLPNLFEEQPDLLHKLVTQLSPSVLRSEGVPVYRCVQNPGEFVLTFPRAYHAGFNCGFNCAEAVNVAPVDWLPHGQNAVELYREQGRQTSISHDKLLFGAAREAVKANWECNLLRKYDSNNLRWKEVCGKDGIVSKTLKTRVEMERVRRDFLCKSSQTLKMESSFDAHSERECCVCLFDLHLSAAGCHHCSPQKYACLNHAKQLCSCSWSAKFFLFRYDLNELKMLVEALEGKLSALYRWARLDLGLALSSYVSKDKSQNPVPSEGLSSPPKVDTSTKKQTKYIGSIHSSQNVKSPVVVLALEKVESAKYSFQCEEDSSLHPASRQKNSLCQISQVNHLKMASSGNLASEKVKGQSSYTENKDVIHLSDDEGDEPCKEPFCATGTSQKSTNMVNLGSSINNTTTTVFHPSVVLETKPHGSACIKVEDERFLGSNQSSTSVKFSSTDPDAKVDVLRHKGLVDNENLKREDTLKKLEEDAEFRSIDSMATVSSPSGIHPHNLDRYYLQKGPRIAKVVRRINCNVEPLDFGAVRAGKLWCDRRAIYPKGFRSRVRYIDVVDPTKLSFYVSEILDAGRDGPLFMVSVEHSPSEVFIHESASRCWEMVRERVNNEIAKQHRLERGNLPPLQPPGSLDGMDMFGFSSPAIMHVIQAMDKNRVCTEYWEPRPHMRIPQESQLTDHGGDFGLKSDVGVERMLHGLAKRILHGLLKKANLEELHTLYRILQNENPNDEHSLLVRLLREETNKYPR
ncbi:hypothetical protein OROGR_025633 [Orobanche gracilis]